MSSPNKHTVLINGHNTSVFVEDDFWIELKKLVTKKVSLSELISSIDQNKKKSNLSSAIRLYILNHLRKNLKMSNQEYLSTLNESQLKAVQNIKGPNLVIAGAGTGKTRVLTTRVAHIIDTQNAFPSQILCVTFTNKAAREMSDRIQTLVDNKLERMPWMGTFHSIGAKIIRNHAELLGLKTSFTILDKDDQLALIKQIIKAENLDQAIYVPKFIQNKIDQWKNKALNPQDIKADNLESMTDDKSHKIYEIYQKKII